MTPRTKGRTAPCHVCRGSATARGHIHTDRHQEALRRISQVRDSGKLARPPAFRDPYGRNRDWDAEQAEARKQRAIEEAAERLVLIRTTLPVPPTVDYASDVALITIAEGARRLGVKPDTLKHAIHRGRMVGHKMGRDWLVEESEVAWYEMRSLGKVGRPRKSRAA